VRRGGGGGFYGSLVQVGFPIGLVSASAVFSLVSLLPDTDFKAWGWRIPFLISVVLVGVGVFVRARRPENPAFEKPQVIRRDREEPVPRDLPQPTQLPGGDWVEDLRGVVGLYADRVRRGLYNDQAGIDELRVEV
jgi:MFS family permease